MGENVYLWSKTASSNDTADPSVNWSENQLPSTVNNSSRSMMAALAKFLDDNNGTLTSTGSSNAYALTANTAYVALATGLTVCFKANFSNTDAATFALTPSGGSAFAAKPVRLFVPGGEIPLTSGQITSAAHIVLHYDAAADNGSGAWVLINPAVPNSNFYETKALAVAARISGAINFITLGGYNAAGDGGASLYKRVGSEPSHAGKLQSADAAWWELAEERPTLEMFGALGDDSTDCTQAIVDAHSIGRPILCGAGIYRCNSRVQITGALRLFGAGIGRTIFKFVGTGTNVGFKSTITDPTNFNSICDCTIIKTAAYASGQTALLIDGSGVPMQTISMADPFYAQHNAAKLQVDLVSKTGLYQNIVIDGTGGSWDRGLDVVTLGNWRAQGVSMVNAGQTNPPFEGQGITIRGFGTPVGIKMSECDVINFNIGLFMPDYSEGVYFQNCDFAFCDVGINRQYVGGVSVIATAQYTGCFQLTFDAGHLNNYANNAILQNCSGSVISNSLIICTDFPATYPNFTGIGIFGGTGVHILDNRIWGPARSGPVGIYITAADHCWTRNYLLHFGVGINIDTNATFNRFEDWCAAWSDWAVFGGDASAVGNKIRLPFDTGSIGTEPHISLAGTNFVSLELQATVVTPLTGATITFDNNTQQIIVNPAGTLATLFVHLPQYPADGQICETSFSQNITAISFTAVGGATVLSSPAGISAPSSIRYKWIQGSSAWFRLS